jgi:hypothetical protein
MPFVRRLRDSFAPAPSKPSRNDSASDSTDSLMVCQVPARISGP